MALITYIPAPGYDSSVGGVVNIGNGSTFDVHAALLAGGGVITVDTSSTPLVASALDNFPGLVRSGSTPGPPIVSDIIRQLTVHSGKTNSGDILGFGSDGVAVGGMALPESQLPNSILGVARGIPLLRWAPPRLTNPLVVQITNATDWYQLNSNQDYILQLPAGAALRPAGANGGAQIIGGRNVVLIGGTVDVSGGTTAPNQTAGRALYFNGQTGTIHIEGLYVSGGNFAEGFDFYCPKAIVQIVNCRMDNLLPDNGAIHPQFVAPYGSVKELRVDRFTGSTAYQGFQLSRIGGGQIGPVELRRVNIVQNAGSAQASTQVLWVNRNDSPTTYRDVWVKPRGTDQLINTVWPSPSHSDAAQRPYTNADGSVAWPAKAGINGVVHLGTPFVGDFAAPGGATGGGYDKPGWGYTTPGYDPAALAVPGLSGALSDQRYAAQLPGLMLPILGINNGSAIGLTANQTRLCRMIAPVDGAIPAVAVFPVALSGNIRAAVYDDGSASAGNRTLLGSSASVAMSGLVANAWNELTLSTPIQVYQGQHIDAGFTLDNGTATMLGSFLQSSAQVVLPSTYLPAPGGAPPKLAPGIGANFAPASPVTEANIIGNPAGSWFPVICNIVPA